MPKFGRQNLLQLAQAHFYRAEIPPPVPLEACRAEEDQRPRLSSSAGSKAAHVVFGDGLGVCSVDERERFRREEVHAKNKGVKKQKKNAHVVR